MYQPMLWVIPPKGDNLSVMVCRGSTVLKIDGVFRLSDTVGAESTTVDRPENYQ